MDEITFESLVHYLSGELTADEKKKIDSALEKDSRLGIMLHEAKLVLQGIHRAGEKEVEEKVKSFHRNLKITGKLDELAQPSALFLNLRSTQWIAIAASLFLVVFVGFTFFKPAANDSLYVNYYTPENTIVTDQLEALNIVGMASQQKVQRESLQKGLVEYSENKYKQSAATFTDYLRRYPQDSIAQLYLGLSFLGDEEYAKAISALEDLSNNSNTEVKDVANWYLALGYLKIGRKKEAITRLKEISYTPSTFSDSATKLIKDLE